jgi:hypothetical protein
MPFFTRLNTDTSIKITPRVATIDDPAGKSRCNEILSPIKLPAKLTIIARNKTS